MKVLFISHDPLVFIEGSPVRLRMREYAGSFGELHVISRGPEGPKVGRDGPLTLYRVSGNKLLGLFCMVKEARRIVRERGIEVASAQDPFEHGLIALAAVRGTAAKLHVQVHTDYLSPHFTGFLNRIRVGIAGFVLPNAAGIRAVSRRVKESLEKRYGRRIIAPAVIPLAVDSTPLPPSPLPLHPFSFAFLTVARLEKEKRIHDILRALVFLPADVGLFVVGEGSERPRLEALSRALGLFYRVIFLGWRTDSLGLLKSAHAYVQASAYEGYGRTLIEAALANLPIVTTDVGIIGEVLRDGEEALVAPVGDVPALSRAMARVCEEEALRAHLGKAAQEAAVRHLAGLGSLAEAVRADLLRLL